MDESLMEELKDEVELILSDLKLFLVDQARTTKCVEGHIKNLRDMLKPKKTTKKIAKKLSQR